MLRFIYQGGEGFSKGRRKEGLYYCDKLFLANHRM